MVASVNNTFNICNLSPFARHFDTNNDQDLKIDHFEEGWPDNGPFENMHIGPLTRLDHLLEP